MENKYAHFKTVDFATDDTFLHHHLAPSVESTIFWKNYLLAYPEKIIDLDEAKVLVTAVQEGLTSYSRTFLSEEAEAILLNRILKTNKETNVNAQIIPIWKKNIFWSVAASITLLFVTGLYVWKENKSEKISYGVQISELRQSVVEKINDSDKVQSYLLPDSSQVLLSPASRLSYPADFGIEDRIVYLSGKAEFNVVKNSRKPFFVYASEIVTKVLGTQFEVSAFEKDADVTVKVQSGRVTVYENTEKDQFSPKNKRTGVLLLPNQQVVFKRTVQQFNKELVEEPAILPTPADLPKFVYEDTPVSHVFADITKSYGVEIVYNEELLEHCQLTASLTEESLMEKLDIVCKSIGAAYEIVEARIIISSKGCQSN